MADRREEDDVPSAGSRIAVIDKVVKVLDVVLASDDGLTPTEVAREVGTNRSTAFRLLVSLDLTGLLSRDPSTGKYRLGMKMLQYGAAVRLGMSVITVAEPILSNLRDETRQTTLLAIREGWGARCLLRIPGLEVDVLSWTRGHWLPLHIGAAAQSLMSVMDEGELERYFVECTEWHTSDVAIDDDDVRRSLAEIRRRGWALSSTTETPGIASLATVVRDPAGAVACAISVSGLESHYAGVELERTTNSVIAAARDISRQLPT